MRGRTRFALAAACGAVAALGQAPWSLWFLALAGFAGLFWLARDMAGWRHNAALGWFGGTGYFAVALFWIIEPFLVDIPRHGWMAPFALVLLAGGLAIIWSAAFAYASLWRGCWRHAALVLSLALSEMLRGLLFTGFPWALVGHIWTNHPILQLAAWGGPHLLTLLTLTVAALFANGLRMATGGVVVIGLAWGAGLAVLQQPDPPATGKTIRLVQPNANQRDKWRAEMAGVFFNRQLAMSREPSDMPLDLIVWPETAIAYRLDMADTALTQMRAAAQGVPLIFGVNAVVDDHYRNALAVLDTQSIRDIYYKHHLVPFGEYIPLGELAATFGINGLAARDGAGFGAGDGPRLVDVPGIGPVLPLICYELIFPRNLTGVERANVIVQITNDAWFGNISGPYQHLAQARLRAVEQGLPVLRAANTGVSAVIDARGRILSQTDLNVAGYIDAGLPGPLPPTLYANWGDVPVQALFALGLLILALRYRTVSD